VWLWSLEIFEVELHTDILEVWHFFDDYSVYLIEQDFSFITTFIKLENEKLILSLLLHDQVLSTNYRQPLFTL